MGDESRRDRHGWLAVEGQGQGAQVVRCPRKGHDVPLSGCLACKRYRSLALSPSGKDVYLDCDWVGADDVRAGKAGDE
ncbi:MAG: hypothetical protein QM820_25235 [Minicystis sp.]